MTAVKSYHFQTSLRWTGAAAGPTSTYAGYDRSYELQAPGKPVLLGSSDVAFRGDASKYNPEDLLLAALCACHLLSYLALCALRGVEVVAYEDSAEATMAADDGKMRFTSVLLRPRCTIRGDLTLARQLRDRAHAECFIANSLNFPVRNEPEVIAAT
ncbi:MAG: peroxiredoxin [Candidatus Meridianibacter frigidus]|nr:MAG: peroxiredoxin [Candidatus Eremiobacteraeota bacterium]